MINSIYLIIACGSFLLINFVPFHLLNLVIQVAPERHTGQRGLKNQSAQNDFKLGPKHISHRPDRGGVNGSSNRAHMRKIERFKV